MEKKFDNKKLQDIKKKDINLKKCLGNFPLRISVSDYCNLRCFFCSNEGMPLNQKNLTHINLADLKILIKILSKKGLKKVSITGGEPTVYPRILDLIDFLNNFNFKELFFHTNGVNLNSKLFKKLSLKFTKLAISIQSVNLNVWNKITGGNKEQFRKLMKNIEIASSFKDRILIELKFVPIKGYNYTEKEIKDFLDLCSKFGFKFKFLNFEPIKENHIGFSVSIQEIKKKLISLGCIPLGKEKKFRGQKSYLPIQPFRYKNCKGVAIEIGCGTPYACRYCYKSNEIFINPKLEIKPCHINPFVIPLSLFIKQKKENAIFQAIIKSRSFLMGFPGEGKNIWG